MAGLHDPTHGPPRRLREAPQPKHRVLARELARCGTLFSSAGRLPAFALAPKRQRERSGSIAAAQRTTTG